MRNLKRVLSLALALVMVLGMMVITTSAAAFTDAEEITYQEAVDVMSAIGVINGFEAADGTFSFKPTETLTREQGATLICYMLMGKANADKLVGSGTFTDVAATRWSAGEIDYCANLGILDGMGDGTFDPTGELKAVQFGKMLLCALGYNADSEGYTGKNWATNIAVDMIDAGLDVNGVAMNATLTREQAAQMCYQTLTANMVDYTTKTEVNTGDATVTINGGRYEIGDNNEALVDSYADYQTPYTQFCEKYFGRLSVVSDNDGMMRPSHIWSVGADEVGEYVDTADYTFVVSSTRTGDVESLVDAKLGRNFVDAGNIAWLNGDGVSATTGYTKALTLNVGDTVEFFMNYANPRVIDYAVVTRYSVEVVDGATATKGTGANTQVRIPGVIPYTSAFMVNGAEGLVRGDVVYFYQDAEGVYYFAAAESFDGTLTAINNVNPKTYVVEGESYTANGSMTPNAMNLGTPVFNTEYRFYTDNNGYVVYGKLIQDVLSDYVVIQEIAYVADGDSIGDDEHVEARLVKMDGTTEIVPIAAIKNYIGDGVYTFAGVAPSATTDTALNSNADAAKGRYLVVNAGAKDINGFVDTMIDDVFFTYTVNFKGEYTLTYVDAANVDQTEITGTATLSAGKVTINTADIPVTDDTVFVVAKRSNGNSFDTYIGKHNVPNLLGATGAYVTANGVVTYMYIDSYTDATITGNSVFFLNDQPNAYYEVKTAQGSYGYHTYDAIVNGEIGEVKVSASAPAGTLDSGNNTLAAGSDPVAIELFTPTYDTNGVITNLAASTADDAVAYGYKLTGTTLVTDKINAANYTNAYVCGLDTVVYYVDVDGNADKITAADLANDDNDQIYVVNGQNKTVAFAVVFEKDSDETGIALEVTGGTLARGTTIGANWTVDGGAKANVTVYTMTGTSSATVKVIPEAGCDIYVSSNSTSNWTLVAGDTVTGLSAGNYACIKVVAEDTTVSYYAVECKA